MQKDSIFGIKISLLNISTILLILGLIFLFFIVAFIQPIPMKINDIMEKDIGKTVTINASVKNKVLRSGNLFLELEDNGSYIKAIMFENNIRNLPEIRANTSLNIVARVDRYMGEIELIINEIRWIS